VTAVLALIGSVTPAVQPASAGESSTPVIRSIAAATTPGLPAVTLPTGPIFAPIGQLPSMTGTATNIDGVPATSAAPTSPIANPPSSTADGPAAQQDVATLMAGLRAAFAKPLQSQARAPMAPGKTASASDESAAPPGSGLDLPEIPLSSTDSLTAAPTSGAAANGMPTSDGKLIQIVDISTADARPNAGPNAMPVINDKPLPTNDGRETRVTDVAITDAEPIADANAMPAIDDKGLPLNDGKPRPPVNAAMAQTVADKAIPNLAPTAQLPAALAQHPAVAAQSEMPPPSHASSSDDVSAAPGPKHAHADTASPVLDAVTLTKADARLDTSTPSAIGQPHATQISSNDATASVAPGPTQAEQSMTRHLDLARDNQWLDRLAHDITQAATANGHLKFQLNPEHLGSLQVEIANSAAGTSVRMTADNDAARTILVDAQPRLIAEVRAQGLRIAESHVDLGSQTGSGGAAGGQRQSSEDHKPFVRTQAATRAQTPDSPPPADDELYA
jgi:flagellar hook-length control protein FliK